MGRASISALGGFLALAGCGTLLDIQPDPAVANDDGGMPVSDGSSTEAVAPVDGAGADAADAADGGSSLAPCSKSPQAPPCVLAEGLVNLGSIAVGNGHVYFTRHENPGAVLQVLSTGGEPVTPFAPSLSLPAGLSATPTALYWVTEGDKQVVRQDFGTSMPVGSANGASSPAAQIVGVGSETFWTVPGVGVNAGEVRASATFNAGAPLATNVDQPTAIAADPTYVYYATKTTSGQVVRLLHDGSAMATGSVAFRGINAIALSTGIVAITSLDGVYRASTQTDMDFMSPWIQVSTNATGVGIVADAVTGTLYVLAADGTLEIIPNVASPPVTKMNVAGCAAGTAIAQGGAHVYLACKDTIVRVPK